MATPLDLAAYIVKHCLEKGKPVSNLQLQKILYFVQLESLKGKSRIEEAIMPDAKFEAWRFGPVIRDVYYAYNLNAAMPIENISLGSNSKIKVPNFVDGVVDRCLEEDPWNLVKFAHREGGPWEKIYAQGYKKLIPNELIIDESNNNHFDAILQQ